LYFITEHLGETLPTCPVSMSVIQYFPLFKVVWTESLMVSMGLLRAFVIHHLSALQKSSEYGGIFYTKKTEELTSNVKFCT